MMLYILLLIGAILIFYGYKNGKKDYKSGFGKVLKDEENSEHIKMMAQHYEVVQKLNGLEEKLDKVVRSLELGGTPFQSQKRNENIIQSQDAQQSNEEKDLFKLPREYGKIAHEIMEMEKKNQSIDEIAATLDLGKGEVQFLRNLWKK